MNHKTTPATAESITMRLAEWSRNLTQAHTDEMLTARTNELSAIEADAVDWAEINQTPLHEQTKLTVGDILAALVRLGPGNALDMDEQIARHLIHEAARQKVLAFARADDGFGNDWADEMQKLPPDVAWTIACELGKDRDVLKAENELCLKLLDWTRGQMIGDSGTGESFWEQYQEYRAIRTLVTASRRKS